MEAPVRQVKDGREFSRFFPAADLENTTIKKNADLKDTMAKIPVVVKRYGYQAAEIAGYLKRETVYETCKNIWNWVYAHITYKKDEAGYEQLRTPARTYHDRKHGVDCDCYTIFISSILTCLSIPHLLRISKNDKDYFQHIYPVVVQEGGREVIMDCVVSAFDFEAPLKEKKDFKMELQILSGFDGDINGLNGDPMGELGKVIKKRFTPGQAKKPAPKPNLFAKPKKAVSPSGTPGVQKKPKGKLLNKINKVNPATATLRNGVLASMKLNISNVAARLRWSYLTDQQAVQRGIDPAKFARLKAVRQRIEDIFFKAGGKPENLKQAILKGKGNNDKAVNGTEFSGFDHDIGYMDEYSPLPELLGYEIYHSENVEGMEGFGSLGEPVTLATIAAASGIIAGIAGLLKQIGDIFQKKSKGSEDFDPAKTEQAEKENPAPAPPPEALPPVNSPLVIPPGNQPQYAYNPPAETLPPPNTYAPPAVQNTRQNQYLPPVTDNRQETQFIPPVTDEKANTDLVRDDNFLPENGNEKTDQQNSNAAGEGGKDQKDDDPGFWAKNKNWLIPVGVGVAGIAVLAIVVASHRKTNVQQRTSSSGKGLNGIKTKRRNHHRKRKPKKNRLTATILL